MANTSGINETINCPNGFYFGDPCYALKEDLYDKWIEWGEEREKTEGHFCNDGKFVYEGKEIMLVDSTAYGDGCYGGNHASYGVDAGCLAVIPLEFCDEEKNFRDDMGWVCEDAHEVKLVTDDTGKFRVYVDDGNIMVGEEVVETGDEEEEEEEEDSGWNDSLDDTPEDYDD